MDSARTEGCVGVGQRRTVISWRIATLANAAVISNPTLPVLLSAAFRAFHERAASPLSPVSAAAECRRNVVSRAIVT